MRRRALVLACALLLAAGCGAPVYHQVRPGETLYSISFRYGKDYHQMAQWNNLAEPYQVNAGQYLRIIPPRRDPFAGAPAPVVATAPAPSAPRTETASAPGAVEVYGLNDAPQGAALSTPDQAAAPRPAPVPAPASPAASTAAQAAAVGAGGWQWPTSRVPARSAVTSGTANKGIDIPGERGEPVRAAASGRVVYSGDGIPHYGKLLILKHDEHYLSAYAHNDSLLVGEGDTVAAGEKIAEMGDSGTGTNAVKLHFEIRRDGEPVDPLKYLPGP